MWLLTSIPLKTVRVGHAADLTTREGNRGDIQAAVDRFGRLDVANAGGPGGTGVGVP